METPSHIAIIMDGNGRWATNQGLPRTAGHTAGADAIEPVINWSLQFGIEYVTFFGLSTKNMQRAPEELQGIFELVVGHFRTKAREIADRNIKISWLGRPDGLPCAVVDVFKEAAEISKDNTGLRLQIAFGYDSIDDRNRALVKMHYDNVPTPYTEEQIQAYMDTAALPPVDLMVRTACANRFGPVWRDSSFLTHLSAEATKVPMESLWPDFSHNDLVHCVNCWQDEPHLDGGQRSTIMQAAE